VKGIYKTSHNVYVIMEYCPDGDLQGLLKKKKKKKKTFNEGEAMSVLNCLLEGVAYLAENGIWHRDVKPSNILIKGDKYKICDYGFTKIVECDPTSVRDFTKVGTPLYCCPQILQGVSYSSKCDVFSIGVILYQMLFQRFPWKAQSLSELAEKVASQKIKYKDKISEEMKYILK